MKNFGQCVLAAMALFSLTCGNIAWAQPSACNNLQVRISNGVQVIDAPVTANCAFSQGGLNGVYTVYSHVTGQLLTPNSPNYSLTANVQRVIFGCVVPSTKQDKMWDVLPNETKCSAPVSKPLSLAVSKTASQNPLVKGKAGQSYAIIFNVSNGPTTAPTLINDTLPTGITTNGPVTASAGTLSGCPTSGAANLSGCTLASGLANGSYTITVPINVGSTASNGNNSASINSQGVTCPNNPNCTASTGNVAIAAAPHVVPTSASAAAMTTINTAALVVPLYTVSVTVSGLASGTNVVLRNNGADNLTVNANGTATFSAAIAGAYAVTVFTQPAMAFCTVTNGAGTATANVTNVLVACGRFAFVPKTGTTNYDVTECFKDTVTGLFWEGKPLSGLRAASNSYHNYDDGTKPQLYGGGNPSISQQIAADNSTGYMISVRGTALCGFVDWRLPSVAELLALQTAAPQYSTLANIWMANGYNYIGWTSTPSSSSHQKAQIVNAGSPPQLGELYRSSHFGIRLVR